jgi:hypothetical protein
MKGDAPGEATAHTIDTLDFSGRVSPHRTFGAKTTGPATGCSQVVEVSWWITGRGWWRCHITPQSSHIGANFNGSGLERIPYDTDRWPLVYFVH